MIFNEIYFVLRYFGNYLSVFYPQRYPLGAHKILKPMICKILVTLYSPHLHSITQDVRKGIIELFPCKKYMSVCVRDISKTTFRVFMKGLSTLLNDCVLIWDQFKSRVARNLQKSPFLTVAR